MVMPGRSFNAASAEEYRYGFQGQEVDNEIKGEGNSVNYKYRMHDPRIGRFFAVDPLTKSYPWYTPYQFAGNNSIKFIDLDGLEEYDPSQDPFFLAKFLVTTFYDTKHAIENVIFQTASIGSDEKYEAQYKKDENGEETMETEIVKVDKGSIKSEMIDFGLNALTIVGGYYGVKSPSPSTGFLFGQTGATNQYTRALDLLFHSFTNGKWVTESINGWSEAAKSYQKFITGIEPGAAFEVNGIRFDGFRGNVLIETKSSYNNFVTDSGDFVSWFTGKEGLLTQAKNQINAAKGAKIEWHFSSEKSMKATQKLFKENNIEGIEFKYSPQQ